MIDVFDDRLKLYAIVDDNKTRTIFRANENEASEMLIWAASFLETTVTLKMLDVQTLQWKDVTTCK